MLATTMSLGKFGFSVVVAGVQSGSTSVDTGTLNSTADFYSSIYEKVALLQCMEGRARVAKPRLLTKV